MDYSVNALVMHQNLTNEQAKNAFITDYELIYSPKTINMQRNNESTYITVIVNIQMSPYYYNNQYRSIC